jgi:hypothetical protein
VIGTSLALTVRERLRATHHAACIPPSSRIAAACSAAASLRACSSCAWATSSARRAARAEAARCLSAWVTVGPVAIFDEVEERKTEGRDITCHERERGEWRNVDASLRCCACARAWRLRDFTCASISSSKRSIAIAAVSNLQWTSCYRALEPSLVRRSISKLCSCHCTVRWPPAGLDRISLIYGFTTFIDAEVAPARLQSLAGS